jgi:hypothetical protein
MNRLNQIHHPATTTTSTTQNKQSSSTPPSTSTCFSWYYNLGVDLGVFLCSYFIGYHCCCDLPVSLQGITVLSEKNSLLLTFATIDSITTDHHHNHLAMGGHDHSYHGIIGVSAMDVASDGNEFCSGMPMIM